MANHLFYAASEGHHKAIYLYTTPLDNQKHMLKTHIEVFAHWAIYIEGRCYELTRNRDKNKKKIDPKYKTNLSDEQDWIYRKKHEEHRG
ncbi:hypothetical protein DL765_006873 [Monosporascus sp. GIB2]|nr:hypothetical protein DL765_006873 [Monosporascus sp. GIB2]